MRFTLGVDATERMFLERDERLFPDLIRMLSRNFCGSFEGAFADKVKEQRTAGEEDEDEPPVQQALPVRTFAVTDFEPIDEPDVPRLATYIADCDFQSSSLTVCGEITYIQERETQKGKRYLRMAINDSTGTLGFSYFPRKRTEEKISALKTGDWIVCTGANELYNGSLGYTGAFYQPRQGARGVRARKAEEQARPRAVHARRARTLHRL